MWIYEPSSLFVEEEEEVLLLQGGMWQSIGSSELGGFALGRCALSKTPSLFESARDF